MRLTARPAVAALVLLASGCASQGTPPGGAPDVAPPLLVRTTPDTGAVGVRADRVTFRFDEVVSERPTGAPTLGALFVISPTDGEPRVNWRRDAVTVAPRRGFRANTVYTVTLLAGLADLRGNVRTEGAEVVFSTGPTIPRTRVAGVLFDWATGQPAARGLVQALQIGPGAGTRDTTTFVTLTDSTGRFAFRSLSPGAYVLRGAIDGNNNRTVDPRELYDTLALTLRDSATVELLAFAHDTVGPRLNAVEVTDSVTIRVAFDQPLSPTLALVPGLFAVTAPDSTRLAIASVAADSGAVAGAPADSAPAPAPAVPLPTRPPGPGADSARAALPRPRPSRPSPPTAVQIRLARPLRAAGSYRVTATNVRNLLGVARTSDRTVDFRPAPPARAPAAPAARPAGAPAPGTTPPPAGPAPVPRRP